MHTKTKGDIGELIAAQELIRRGWIISFPFGENARYDLVAESNSVFRRIQVKSRFPKNGVLRVNCKSSNNWSVIKYTERHFDYLAVVNLDSFKTYFVASVDMPQSSISIRIHPAKNNQTKFTNSPGEFLQFK